MGFQKQVEVMTSGGLGYNHHYSRRESEIDFLDLHLHLGRMEVNANTYDLHRIGYEPHRTETEIATIREDLKLLGELSSQKERGIYCTTPEVFEDVDKLKRIEEEKERSEPINLSSVLRSALIS